MLKQQWMAKLNLRHQLFWFVGASWLYSVVINDNKLRWNYVVLWRRLLVLTNIFKTEVSPFTLYYRCWRFESWKRHSGNIIISISMLWIRILMSFRYRLLFRVSLNVIHLFSMCSDYYYVFSYLVFMSRSHHNIQLEKRRWKLKVIF